MMKILNLYCSITGNTKKVALQIEKTVKSLGMIEVTTIEVTKDSDPNAFDLLDFDFIWHESTSNFLLRTLVPNF